MAQTEIENPEEMDEDSPDKFDEIVAEAKAAAKRIKQSGAPGGKPVNLPRAISGDVLPLLVALAEETAFCVSDQIQRLEVIEAAIGAAGIGTGHPLAAMPAPAAVELLQGLRGLCEAFIGLESAPTPEMKEQAKNLAMAIDMAFQQAGEFEEEESDEEEEETDG